MTNEEFTYDLQQIRERGIIRPPIFANTQLAHVFGFDHILNGLLSKEYATSTPQDRAKFFLTDPLPYSDDPPPAKEEVKPKRKRGRPKKNKPTTTQKTKEKTQTIADWFSAI